MLSLATIGGPVPHGSARSLVFSWYYMDIVDRSGNGLVLVWSQGLPFLAGSRQHLVHSRRPALHIATFREGRPHQYLLQEPNEAEVEFDVETGNARFGRSQFRVEHNGDTTQVEAKLDIDLPEPGERWIGEVVLRGKSVKLPPRGAVTADAEHVWRPLCFWADAHASLTSRNSSFEVQGSGYLDSNSSTSPLHLDDVRRWDWGRVRFGDMVLVYYLVRSEHSSHAVDYVLACDPLGNCRFLESTATGSDHTLSHYAVESARRWEFETSEGIYEVRLEHPVDQSPFYERFIVRGTDPSGNVGTGVAEAVLPGRIDQTWMRPFVRMKTHHLGATNSLWLPLFSGATGTPWKRFARALRGQKHVQ